MTIFELSVPTLAPAFKCESPFIFSCYPGIWATGSYWTTAFGAPAESSVETMFISSFTRDGINRYASVASQSLCEATEQSFYWDNTNQKLWVHLEHDQYPIGPVCQYGKVHGYCKERAIYIDDTFYAPIIDSIPSLSQLQDLEAYDTLTFMSGNVVLKNDNGYIDWMLDIPPFGFECQVADFNDIPGVDTYLRSVLTYRASLYVEDFSATLKKTTLNLQDRRKAQNIKVPTELFNATDYPNIEDGNIDKPIPLLYGTVRAITPIRTNGKLTSGVVTYRIAQSLVSLGTVQVKKTINEKDVWVTKTPTIVDLSRGEFTLSATDGRDGTSPYDVRVLAPNQTITRIDEFFDALSSNPANIIFDLTYRYLGAQYLSSEYDTVEWELARSGLADIGIYIDSQVELYELIRKIQSGSSIGFRYEFNALGQRTIRLDDWERPSSFVIPRVRIENIEDVKITTDSDLLAASVKITYAKDYSGTLSTASGDDKDFLTVIDASQQSAVRLAYKQEPQLLFESLLQTAELSAARALLDVTKYSKIRMVATVRVLGAEFLSRRIYDTCIIELVPIGYDRDTSTVFGSRRWVGVWRAIILGVNPDTSSKVNEITLALIENITDTVPLLAEVDGVLLYLTTEDGRMLLTR